VGVMIIKYTMNRDARWRGIYGGYGRGAGRGKKMDGDEMWNNESIVPPKNPPCLQAMRFSQTTIGFSVAAKERRGQKIDKNESLESKKRDVGSVNKGMQA